MILRNLAKGEQENLGSHSYYFAILLRSLDAGADLVQVVFDQRDKLQGPVRVSLGTVDEKVFDPPSLGNVKQVVGFLVEVRQPGL
jgi:hypothetical protein